MLKLAIVTHTKGDAHRWFEPMRASVRAAMPDGAEHHIIQCNSHAELETARWDALRLAEYVCFVDDDDRIINNSIRLCLNALEANPDLAVAFTNERYVDADGQTLPSPHDPDRHLDYVHVHDSAQTIHHLTMIRTAGVVWEAQRLLSVLGIGGEWLLKASAALDGGAIHVPIEGYEWRRHDTQYSSTDDWRVSYNSNIHKLSAYLAAQSRHRGPIPRLTIAT